MFNAVKQQASSNAIPPNAVKLTFDLPEGFGARILNLDDTDEVMALRSEILANLPHADLYVRETDERGFVQQHLGDRGTTIGVTQGGELVAYAMLGLPQPEDTDHLGHLLNLPDHVLGLVAYVSSCMVKPTARGLGLQRSLLQARQQLAAVHERSMLLGMVSLHNHPSRRNMLRAGFQVHWVGILEGYLQRQIMFLDRRARIDPDSAVGTGDGFWVAADNFEMQVELTSRGYRGVSERGRDGRFFLYFTKEPGRNN